MATSLSKSTLFSTMRSHFQKGEPYLTRRRYHIELGAREKALLEEDPALKRFRSYKGSVKRASKIGNILTGVILAACSYEIYAVSTRK